jgi:hypothetical protein
MLPMPIPQTRYGPLNFYKSIYCTALLISQNKSSKY